MLLGLISDFGGFVFAEKRGTKFIVQEDTEDDEASALIELYNVKVLHTVHDLHFRLPSCLICFGHR